jgi:hypothetical protein
MLPGVDRRHDADGEHRAPEHRAHDCAPEATIAALSAVAAEERDAAELHAVAQA